MMCTGSGFCPWRFAAMKSSRTSIEPPLGCQPERGLGRERSWLAAASAGRADLADRR